MTPPSAPTNALPASLTSLHPALVSSMRATAGPEAYYALAVPVAAPKGSAEALVGENSYAVIFVAIDPEGQLRPGAWSYGETVSSAPYGRPSTPAVAPLDPALVALRQSYLATLCSAC